MTVRVFNSKINVLPSRDERPQTERCLSAREIERLAGIRKGNSIVCTNGVLWVTQEGDPEDYMLKKGEKFVANRQGVVLVQAFNESARRFYLK
jgi:hypothetical protein